MPQVTRSPDCTQEKKIFKVQCCNNAQLSSTEKELLNKKICAAQDKWLNLFSVVTTMQEEIELIILGCSFALKMQCNDTFIPDEKIISKKIQ